MSTTAIAGNNNAIIGQNGIMPREKSTRQIVREEIKRQKALDELEQKHDAGEISDFEYRANKFLLNLPIPNEMPSPCTVKYSNEECGKINCVA